MIRALIRALLCATMAIMPSTRADDCPNQLRGTPFRVNELELGDGVARWQGRDLKLKKRKAVVALLDLLVDHADRVLSQKEVIAKLWPDPEGRTQAELQALFRVTLMQLRRAFAFDPGFDRIETVRATGLRYRSLDPGQFKTIATDLEYSISPPRIRIRGRVFTLTVSLMELLRTVAEHDGPISARALSETLDKKPIGDAQDWNKRRGTLQVKVHRLRHILAPVGKPFGTARRKGYIWDASALL